MNYQWIGRRPGERDERDARGDDDTARRGRILQVRMDHADSIDAPPSRPIASIRRSIG
jgi:hypothetical protein